MTRQRTRIRTHVRSNPGVHFNEVVRNLDLAPGQVQYHLRRLLGQGAVVEARLYGQTHYYPPGYEPWERAALALLRRETARDVVLHVLEHGPVAPAAVADALGIARSTLEWHLDRLAERDIVRKVRDDGRVTLVVTRPEATARLFSLVSPSLPERMVSRFARLVDGLLDE
ncbi:winged helix-turn-helix transcriptional regulator [Halomarina halobia]|uniref:Winged helix-turn-helix transcriptional regulator n=1 Tax=Halomarina halobia TaxID=3033386 RepID=A0ABD6A7I9_9EURY|nr:helix-turn-helix domain-containing protein [Halomarina sp. PSR21]